MNARAQFTRMQDSTQQDWQLIGGEFMQFTKTLPNRVLAHLKLLDGDYGGFPIDRYSHCLQTATRALRDGRDDEYVVCALLHDIGDTLGTFNHPDIAAAILKPFVSEANHWMVQNHGMFQGNNFFHHSVWTATCATRSRFFWGQSPKLVSDPNKTRKNSSRFTTIRRLTRKLKPCRSVNSSTSFAA